MTLPQLFRRQKQSEKKNSTNAKIGLNMRDFCYSRFGWMGRSLAKVFKVTDDDLEAAYMKMHPEVYFSIIGFVALLSLPIPIISIILFLMGMLPRLPIPILGSYALVMIPCLSPLIIILAGFVIPKTVASNRISTLKVEIPYASMYMSVMTSGGLSPYRSLQRIRNMDLLPNMKKEVERISTIVTSRGYDPVSAMEEASKVVRLNEYRDLLLGYASTVRTGGDVIHYMFNQTETMFRGLSSRIRSLGERMGVLMEAFLSVGILGALGLFLVFVVGLSLPYAGMGIPPDLFFLFSFIILPAMSGVFIYMGDTMQLNYPVTNWKPHMVFAATMPIGLISGILMVLPFFDKQFLVFPPAYDFVIWFRTLLGFAEGTEASLGISLALIILCIPGVIADYYFVGREANIQLGITQFLRDLVETRKTGMSPERCIEALSTRDYKAFSKYLKTINVKLGWGFPAREIYQDFRAKVQNWLALINVYLLVDTLEVGGGTQESLETLTGFSESMRQLDNEKKSMLLPLIIVPYLGAILLTATTVMFLQFFTSLAGLGLSIAKVTLYRVLMTPLPLHSFMMGLVTGKIINGSVPAGFKHAIILIVVSLIGIWAVSNLQFGGIIGS